MVVKSDMSHSHGQAEEGLLGPHLTEFNSVIKYFGQLDSALNIVKITAKFQRHLQ